MKTLEQEAKEYGKSKYRKEDYSAIGYTLLVVDATRHFKAGANSNHAERRRIDFAFHQLAQVFECHPHATKEDLVKKFATAMVFLEQQLKQLEK